MLSKSFLEHFLRCGWSTIAPFCFGCLPGSLEPRPSCNEGNKTGQMHMGQAHVMGISQGGGAKLTKVSIFFTNLCCRHVFNVHIYCKLGPLNGVTFI